MSFYNPTPGASTHGGELIANLTEDQVRDRVLSSNRGFMRSQHVDILGFIRGLIGNVLNGIGQVIGSLLGGNAPSEGLDFLDSIVNAFKPLTDKIKELETEQSQVVTEAAEITQQLTTLRSETEQAIQKVRADLQNVTLDGVLTEKDKGQLLKDIADSTTAKIDELQNKLLQDLDKRVRANSFVQQTYGLALEGIDKANKAQLAWNQLVDRFMLLQTNINKKFRYLFEAEGQTRTGVLYFDMRASEEWWSVQREIRVKAFNKRKGLIFSSNDPHMQNAKWIVQARASNGAVDFAVIDKVGNTLKGKGQYTQYNSGQHGSVLMPYDEWLRRMGSGGSSASRLENIVTFTDKECILVAGGFIHEYEEVIVTVIPEYQPVLLGHEGPIVEQIRSGNFSV